MNAEYPVRQVLAYIESQERSTCADYHLHTGGWRDCEDENGHHDEGMRLLEVLATATDRLAAH